MKLNKRLQKPFLISVAAAALALGGCGGSEGPHANPPTPDNPPAPNPSAVPSAAPVATPPATPTP